jgi:hypothetical protein
MAEEKKCKMKLIIEKNFILSSSLPLDMTRGVKTLGSALLFSLMDSELSEIQRWNCDDVSQIFTYSQLHKLIDLYIIITSYQYPVLLLTGFKFV